MDKTMPSDLDHYMGACMRLQADLNATVDDLYDATMKLEKIYQIATRALAEPSDTGALVQICTIIEGKPKMPPGYDDIEPCGG